MSFLRREIRAVVGGLPATFWWLWAGVLVNAVASFVVPFLALYLMRRGFSPTTAGILVGLVGAGSVVAAPLGGILADRVGRKGTMVVSLVLTATTTAALALVRSPWSAAVLVTLMGTFVHLFRPAAMAVVADVVPAADRVRAFGLNYWAVNLGIAVSSVLGGVIAQRSFTGLFLADAATTLVFAGVVLLRIPETRPQEAAAAAREPLLRSLAAVAGDRVFAVFLLLHVAYASVLLQFLAAAPMDVTAHGVSLAMWGPILAVNGVVIALVQPFAARATARYDPARVLALAALLTGGGYALFSVFHTPLLYAAAVVVITLGEVAYTPTAIALVANLSPVAQRGRYQGVYSMGWGLATAAGPALGAVALDRAGSVATWLGCAGVGALVAAGQLAAARARRRRLAGSAVAAP